MRTQNSLSLNKQQENLNFEIRNAFLENETTIRPPGTHTMQTHTWGRFLLMIVKHAYYEKNSLILLLVHSGKSFESII